MPHFSALAFTAFEWEGFSLWKGCLTNVKATKLCFKILLFRPFINLSWHSFSIGANHQSFIVLRTLNSATKSVGLEGHAGRGRAESSQGPKNGGEGRRAAGGRVTGKDWSHGRQREGRGVRRAAMHWRRGEGCRQWTEGERGLESLCWEAAPWASAYHPATLPSQSFSRVRVKRETRNRGRERLSFSSFIQVPLESSVMVPWPATGCLAGSLPPPHQGLGSRSCLAQTSNRALSSFLAWFTVGYMLCDVLGGVYWVHC